MSGRTFPLTLVLIAVIGIFLLAMETRVVLAPPTSQIVRSSPRTPTFDPRMVGYVPNLTGFGYLGVYGNTYYASAVKNIDITDSSNPYPLRQKKFEDFYQFGGAVMGAGGWFYMMGAEDWRGARTFYSVNISDPLNPTIRGRFDQGLIYGDLAYQNGRVYLLYGFFPYRDEYHIKVIRVTDPENPQVEFDLNLGESGITNYANPDILTVDRERGLLYLIFGRNIVIYDISDVGQPPRRRGSFPISDDQYIDAEVLTAAGTRHFLYEQDNQPYDLLLMNVNDPDNPVSGGSVTLSEKVGTLAVKDHYAYVSFKKASEGDDGKIQVVDAASRSAGTIISGPDIGAAAVYGNYLFTGSSVTALSIYDLADPENPRALGKIPVTRDPAGVAWLDNIVYVSIDPSGSRDDDEAIAIIDVSRPSEPVLKKVFMESHYRSDGALLAFTLQGRRYLLTAGGGFYSIDDLLNPVWLDVRGASTAGLDFFIDGNYLYSVFGDGGDGLKIIALANLAQNRIEQVGSYKDGTAYVEGVWVRNGIAYLAYTTNGFHLLDVSDPRNPRLITKVLPEKQSDFTAVIADDRGFAYLLDGHKSGNGVAVYDVRDPENPRQTLFVDPIGESPDGTDDLKGLGYENDHLYAVCGETCGRYYQDYAGLWVYNLNPERTEAVLAENFPRNEVEGGRRFVVNSTGRRAVLADLYSVLFSLELYR